ncbi:hypothetical protein CASFOL_021727 [Castilleja foliolosa]|uniref:Uncharacterized protein n=1 Tax=Castilleja foliolosa TaxID=1961234 RepID=A0ABD3CXE9_9LAMI
MRGLTMMVDRGGTPAMMVATRGGALGDNRLGTVDLVVSDDD